MPRPYNLGARAASVDDTKRRILEAANAEYAKHGVEGTSMHAVARSADVAPGTVRYHYATPEALAEAVATQWVATMGMPDPAAIDSSLPFAERFRSLVSMIYDLLERSEPIYEVWRKSPNHPAFVAVEEEFNLAVGTMLAAALGDRMSNAEAVAVASVMIDPGFRGTLISRGIAPDRAIEVASELGLAWLS